MNRKLTNPAVELFDCLIDRVDLLGERTSIRENIEALHFRIVSNVFEIFFSLALTPRKLFGVSKNITKVK